MVDLCFQLHLFLLTFFLLLDDLALLPRQRTAGNQILRMAHSRVHLRPQVRWQALASRAAWTPSLNMLIFRSTRPLDL